MARASGLDPYAILKKARIEPKWLEDPQRPLPARAVVHVFEESASLTGRDDFGIMLAQCRTFASLGPVALLLQHEHTIRDIVNAAIEHRHVLEEAVWLRLDEEGSTAILRFDLQVPYATPQIMAHVVAVAAAALIDASEGLWRPASVHFRHGVPQHLRTYQRYFACALEFDSSFDGLTCPRAALDIRNPLAEPMLATYARQLLSLAPESAAKPSVAEYVRNSIYLQIHQGSPTLERVASTLGMSARSVQRSLASEGETFEKILKATRRELAIRYLAFSDRPVTEVAYDLGFASLSSFQRWFKSAFLTSPMKWRKGNAGRESRRAGTG